MATSEEGPHVGRPNFGQIWSKWAERSLLFPKFGKLRQTQAKVGHNRPTLSGRRAEICAFVFRGVMVEQARSNARAEANEEASSCRGQFDHFVADSAALSKMKLFKCETNLGLLSGVSRQLVITIGWGVLWPCLQNARNMQRGRLFVRCQPTTKQGIGTNTALAMARAIPRAP